MLTITCLLIAAICAWVALNELPRFEHRFGKCTFFASYGLIFGVAPLMQTADAYVHVFGQRARTEASLYALVGLLVLLAGFRLVEQPMRLFIQRKQNLHKSLARPENQAMLARLYWISIGITICGQMLMMHTKGITLTEFMLSGRFEHRFTNQGFASVFALHLLSFVYVPAFIGLFLSRRYQILTLIYIPLSSAAFFFVLSKGTRSVPLAMIITLLVSASIRYRFSMKQIVFTTGAVALSLTLAIGLFELRQHQDSITIVQGIQILCSPDTYQDMWDRDPLGYSSNLVGAVATFPESYPYLNGATYQRMAVFFLQESQFPDLKPPDTNIVFGLVVHDRPEDLQVTVPPSILGDVYINFWGWWGLIALLFHGILYCWMLQSMQTSLFSFLWIGPLSGRFLVLVHRGEPYEMYFLFVMFFFFMTLINFFNRPSAQVSQHRIPPRRTTRRLAA